jgi:hypothetical protein
MMKQPIGPLPENIEKLTNTVVYDNIKQFESGQGNLPMLDPSLDLRSFDWGF